MLNEQTMTKLYAMKLNGLADGYEEQRQQPRMADLSFDERFGLLVDRQWRWREERALTTRLRNAKFKLQACVEDIDYQAIARCIIGEQMIRIAKRYDVVLTVHDAIACVVKEDEVLEAQTYIEECMKWIPDWADGLPVSCESGYGQSYGDC